MRIIECYDCGRPCLCPEELPSEYEYLMVCPACAKQVFVMEQTGRDPREMEDDEIEHIYQKLLRESQEPTGGCVHDAA